jgi:hypothetical protein
MALRSGGSNIAGSLAVFTKLMKFGALVLVRQVLVASGARRKAKPPRHQTNPYVKL